jgi:hypothetical protein
VRVYGNEKKKEGESGMVSPGDIRGEKKRKGKRKSRAGREKERERKEKKKKERKERGERKTLTLESVRVFLRSNSYGHSRNYLILGLIS